MSKKSRRAETTLASYRTLLEVSRLLLGSATLDELFDRITAELKRLVPYDAVTIYRVNEVLRRIDPVHSVDRWAEEIMDSPLDMGEGITGWVIEHGTAENLPAAHTDPRIAIVPGTPADEREALACVPLRVRDQPIGALNVYRLGADTAFDRHEFELICRFADLAALAIDNADHRERLVREAQTDWLTGLFNHRFFHERLRVELDRAKRYARPASLIVFDLDDFKLLNDVHGHQEGDLVLRRVAAAAGEDLRGSDTACRVGGEEFAILLPETGKEAGRIAADRLCARVRALPGVRPITVSCGIATFPEDAGNPTEFLAAADAALYTAKARGKDGAVPFSASALAERTDTGAGAQMESLAQIRAMSALASKLNRLNDVSEIGETIAVELRAIVDYQNARIYLLEDDDETLEPIAFRGDMEYEGETLDALRTVVGEGITGMAAATGRTLNVADANACEYAVDIPGTDDADESILAVPLRYDGRTIGVVVLSKLGFDQFSQMAVRLVELLAAQAAVALENARLFAAQRRTAAAAEALLAMAAMAADERSTEAVARHITRTACELTGSVAAAVVQTVGRRAAVAAVHGDESARSIGLAVAHAIEPDAAGVTMLAVEELPAVSAELPSSMTRAAVAPVHGGLLVVMGEQFSISTLATVGEVAGQATLALRSAELLSGLRRAV